MAVLIIDKLNYRDEFVIPESSFFDYEAGDDLEEVLLDIYVKTTGKDWVKEVLYVLQLSVEIKYDPEDVLKVMGYLKTGGDENEDKEVSNGEDN